MIIGIVGAEAAKFTLLGEMRAKLFLCKLVADPQVDGVASGCCHLGGIDIWAQEATEVAGKPFFPFPPRRRNWESYRSRNIQIANKSHKVWCIAVDTLPKNFDGMRFDYCYHCRANAQIPAPQHVKSGGCWTMYYALKHGKQGSLYVVHNFEEEMPGAAS